MKFKFLLGRPRDDSAQQGGSSVLSEPAGMVLRTELRARPPEGVPNARLPRMLELRARCSAGAAILADSIVLGGPLLMISICSQSLSASDAGFLTRRTTFSPL